MYYTCRRGMYSNSLINLWSVWKWYFLRLITEKLAVIVQHAVSPRSTSNLRLEVHQTWCNTHTSPPSVSRLFTHTQHTCHVCITNTTHQPRGFRSWNKHTTHVRRSAVQAQKQRNLPPLNQTHTGSTPFIHLFIHKTHSKVRSWRSVFKHKQLTPGFHPLWQIQLHTH